MSLLNKPEFGRATQRQKRRWKFAARLCLGLQATSRLYTASVEPGHCPRAAVALGLRRGIASVAGNEGIPLITAAAA
jgi:hypothetical protein